jgi:hypothetical protein
MSKRLLFIVGVFLSFVLPASGQSPSPEAMKAARSLVTTMRLPDQYRALLPDILFRLKPLVTQERPEMERDFDIIAKTVGDAYMPFYNDMIEQAAALYAANFTVEEMRQMDAFFHQPVGQKLLQRWPTIAQQASQIGQEVSSKATEDLRVRFTEALRQKGH